MKNSIRPASVWVSGRDQHYLALRTDVRSADTDTLNPYLTAYDSYLHLVLQVTFDWDLPLWLSNGLSGVLSNTIVRENQIRLGMPIPWHLQYLQERTRMPLGQLVAVNRSSPEYEAALAAAYAVEGLVFDAEDNREQAKAAYAKAVELGAPSAFAHYRWAQLYWDRDLDAGALVPVEKALAKAVELDAGFAGAHSFLAQTRLALGRPAEETVPLMNRAIELEPGEPYHRLVAARTFLSLRSYVAAREQARIALRLQRDDGQRQEAEEILASIDREMKKMSPK